MKVLSSALYVLLAISTNRSLVQASSPASSIANAVGDGCENSINFSGSFTTDSGDACNSCHFCDGSKLGDLFSPKSQGVCVECSSDGGTCTNLQVTTSFDTPWVMTFIRMSASSKASNFDPKRIVLDGSTDSKAWDRLCDSDKLPGGLFETRDKVCEYPLPNKAEYDHFRITFKLKDSATKMYIGHYGIVPTYTKQCSLNVYTAITGDPMTKVPTESPTKSPTKAAKVPCTATFVDNEGNKYYNAKAVKVDENTYVFGGLKGTSWKMAAVDETGQHITHKYMSASLELNASNWKKANPGFAAWLYYVKDVKFC